MRNVLPWVLASGILLASCGGEAEPPSRPVAEPRTAPTITVAETTVTRTFEAAGVAEPIERATLSTRLMGSVTQVLVKEGDRVARGQTLARVDARDVEAKRTQVDAGIAAAEAVYRDALTQAERFRALYADSAATRFQLEQVETGLARAEAGLRTARASREELDAVGAYSEIRSPFAGIVTRRYVDPGAFAAPGAPVVEVQDASRLRVSVTVPPRIAGALRRGQAIVAAVESQAVQATIEGVVPAPSGAVYTVNAIVANTDRRFLPGSAATLTIPEGERQAILIPASALVREGDLTGVRVQTATGSDLRWVRTGTEYRVPSTEHPVGDESTRYSVLGPSVLVEVLSGLLPGDVILAGNE
jgi:RND family efflux transporter MFP subunit